MSAKSWIVLASLFVILIFVYDFMTKTPSRRMPIEHMVKIDYATWLEFAAPDKSFKAKFPSLPQYASINDAPMFGLVAGKVSQTVYAAQAQDKTKFSVTLIKPAKPLVDADVDGLIDDVVSNLSASTPGSGIAGKKQLEFLSHTALDVTLQGAATTLKSRIFYANSILYVVTVSGKTAERVQADFDMFTRSFTLTPE